MALLGPPQIQIIGDDGLPVRFAKMYVFNHATGLPVKVWQDNARTVEYPRPIIADAMGAFNAIYTELDELDCTITTYEGVEVLNQTPLYAGDTLSYVDTNGSPLAGAKMYFTRTGTVVPASVFQDDVLSVPFTDFPIVANEDGEFPSVYSDEPMRVRIIPSDGDLENPLFEVDPISTWPPVVHSVSIYTLGGGLSAIDDADNIKLYRCDLHVIGGVLQPGTIGHVNTIQPTEVDATWTTFGGQGGVASFGFDRADGNLLAVVYNQLAASRIIKLDGQTGEVVWSVPNPGGFNFAGSSNSYINGFMPSKGDWNPTSRASTYRVLNTLTGAITGATTLYGVESTNMLTGQYEQSATVWDGLNGYLFGYGEYEAGWPGAPTAEPVGAWAASSYRYDESGGLPDLTNLIRMGTASDTRVLWVDPPRKKLYGGGNGGLRRFDTETGGLELFVPYASIVGATDALPRFVATSANGFLYTHSGLSNAEKIYRINASDFTLDGILGVASGLGFDAGVMTFGDMVVVTCGGVDIIGGMSYAWNNGNFTCLPGASFVGGVARRGAGWEIATNNRVGRVCASSVRSGSGLLVS